MVPSAAGSPRRPPAAFQAPAGAEGEPGCGLGALSGLEQRSSELETLRTPRALGDGSSSGPAGEAGRGGGSPRREGLGRSRFALSWPEAAGRSRLVLLRWPPPPPPLSRRRRSPRRRRRSSRRGEEVPGLEDGAPGFRGWRSRAGRVPLLPGPALEEPAAGGGQGQGRRRRARWGPRAPHCGHSDPVPAAPEDHAGRPGRCGEYWQQVERLQEAEASAGPSVLLLAAQPVLLLTGAPGAGQSRQSRAGVHAAPPPTRASAARG